MKKEKEGNNLNRKECNKKITRVTDDTILRTERRLTDRRSDGWTDEQMKDGKTEDGGRDRRQTDG